MSVIFGRDLNSTFIIRLGGKQIIQSDVVVSDTLISSGGIQIISDGGNDFYASNLSGDGQIIYGISRLLFLARACRTLRRTRV